MACWVLSPRLNLHWILSWLCTTLSMTLLIAVTIFSEVWEIFFDTMWLVFIRVNTANFSKKQRRTFVPSNGSLIKTLIRRRHQLNLIQRVFHKRIFSFVARHRYAAVALIVCGILCTLKSLHSFFRHLTKRAHDFFKSQPLTQLWQLITLGRRIINVMHHKRRCFVNYFLRSWYLLKIEARTPMILHACTCACAILFVNPMK